MNDEAPVPLEATKIPPEVLTQIQDSMAHPRVKQLCALYNGLCEGSVKPNVYDDLDDDDEEPEYSISDDPPTISTEWYEGRRRCVLTLSEEGLYFYRSNTGMDDREEDRISLRGLANISYVETFCEQL